MARKKGAARVLVRPRYENDRRAIIGVRVSEDRDRGHERRSEDDQLHKARGLLQAKSLEEIHVYQEIGVSGDANREALEDAIQRIERGEAAWLVVYRVDRLGRDFLDVVETVERVTQAGGCLLVVDPLVDTSSDAGRLIIAILGELARAERAKITANWNVAQEGAWKRGKYPGDLPCGLRNPWTADDVKRWRQGLATPPEGVDGDQSELEDFEPGHPVPQHVPHEVEAIREVAKALEHDGISWSLAADMLTEKLGRGGRRMPRKHGGEWAPTWSPRGARYLFSNRLLVGEVAFGDRPVIRDAFEPILTHTQFEAINQPRRPACAKNVEARHVGTGTLRCAGCRHCLHHRTSGKGQRTYFCRNRICPNPTRNIPAEEVEALLVDVAFGAHRERMAETMAHGDEQAGRSISDVDSDIAAVRTRMRNFGLLLADDPEDEGLLAGRVKLKEQLADLEAERRAMTVSVGATHRAFSYRPLFEQLEPAEQIRHIKAVLDTVFIEAGEKTVAARMHAFPLSSYPDELPSKGRSIPLASFVPADYVPVEIGVATAA
jgi:DNA invertase Pin-like site-specific DNA recombinase